MLTHLLSVGKLNISLLLGMALVLIVIGGLILFAWQRSILTARLEENTALKDLIAGIRGTNRLEDNLSVVLGILSKMIEVPYLAYYVQDTRSNSYVLRSVSHPYDGFGGIGPSYSGLALPKREVQLPPMVMQANLEYFHSLEFVKDGAVPLLLMRTRGRSSLIRIGPVEKVTRRTRRNLKSFLLRTEGMLDDLVQLDIERMRQGVTEVADRAVKKVAALAIDTAAGVEIIVRAFAQMSGGVGGIFLQDPGLASGKFAYGVGHIGQSAEVLNERPELFQVLDGLRAGRPYVTLTRTDEAFYDLPSFLSGLDVGAVAIVEVRDRGVLMFFYDSGIAPAEFFADGLGKLQVLHEQLAKVSTHYRAQQKLSAAYSKLLVQMMSMVDNLNPYTVGYSEMVMRYSLVIGKEMGMSDDELMDLALASNLSNIGVIGLDMQLLVKEGQYTDFEYETMKLHCETGASMIQVATGNQRAASYVLYHHERMDGLGYPHGLRGDSIPLGARILHVAQLFLAKVNGREWRDALPFDKALDELRKASGTQVDPDVVQAFFSWIRKRQGHPEAVGKSLGRCYEMLSVPKSICESCAVYQQPEEVHCWTVGSNECRAHGKECSTCFVRTEYMNREQLGYAMEQRQWQAQYMS